MLQSPVAESHTKIKARAQFVYNLLCLRIYLILISVDGFLMFSFFFFLVSLQNYMPTNMEVPSN